MRMVRSWMVLALLSPPLMARAQQATTVSGHVTGESQLPVPGVSVSIATLGVGGQTDAQGRYSFTVPASRATGQSVSITARRIGYQAKTATVVVSGSTVTQDFALVPTAAQLTGIVVTALGQTKEKSRLGTAQQEITGEALTQTFAQNIEDQMKGKVAGVNIVPGSQGGSTNVTIRGYTSISQTNQPLFVIDGVPVSNQDRGSSQTGTAVGVSGISANKDFGNTIQDINPDDVASLTVLKGPNAAALYGSRAANGAIIITTKRGGTGGANMTFNSLVTMDRPSRLPDFQNQYGQGASGEFKWVNGLGALDGNDQSYGPKLDGRLIDQFTGPQQPWVAHPDNVSSFFNSGHTTDVSAAVSGGTDRTSARLSIAGENVDGIIPNSFFRRMSGMASGSVQASDRLTLNGSVNYVRNGASNRPGQGYSGGIMEGLFVWFGRQVDMQALKAGYQNAAALNNGPDNREFNWNYSYHNNPYWMQYQNPEADQRDRVIATGSAAYRLADWLSATLRSGTDSYRNNANTSIAQGNIELNNVAAPPVNAAYAGAFSNIADTYSENNTDLLLSANHDLNSHFSLSANAGGNRRFTTLSTTVVSVNGITVPGIYNVANAALAPVNQQFLQTQAVNSAYGSASFTFNRWWTVEGTARNDWSSTLPKANNSYFYPSVNTSVILTDAIPALQTNWLNFLKLRAGTARVGNDAPPYSLYTTYIGNANKFGGQSLFSLSNALLNPDLKPEQTVGNEAGLEMGMFDGRLTVDGSIFDKYTTDQITAVALPPTTGYGTKLVNAGKIDNRGYELLLTVLPIRNNRLNWSSTINFSHTRAHVVSLAPGLDNIVFGGFQGVVQVEARVGEEFGAIRGFDVKRNADGVPLLDNAGQWQAADTISAMGSIQPDWIGGWINTVRVGRMSFGATLDMRHGGKIFSGTNYYGQATGTLASTLMGREVDWNNPGVVINGIIESTGKQNTTNITTEQYFQSLVYSGVVTPYVYDDSYVKLRELRVGYDVPASLTGRANLNAVNLALVGRNLWTHTKVPNVDPEISYNTGNNQGLEYAGLPQARSVGLSVRITP